MHHPRLHRPHFAEYFRVFPSTGIPLPHFREEFAYHEFCRVVSSEEMRAYLRTLLHAAPAGTIPMLQFNRSSLRQDWCKRHFPHGLHLYLRRNPRHQFESYVQRNIRDTNIFLGINLLIAHLAPAENPLATDPSCLQGPWTPACAGKAPFGLRQLFLLL